MKLVLKIVGYGAGAVVALLVLVVIVLQLISDDRYRKWAEAAAASATGRELAIDGAFAVRIGTTLGLLARDVRFANADWGSRKDMLTADRLLVQLDLLPLFRGVLDVTVEADRPDVLLETSETGQGNWVLGPPEAAQKPDQVQEPGAESAGPPFALPLKPYIRNLQVNGGALVFKNESGEEAIQAEVERFRLHVDGSDIPLSLAGSYQGAPVSLEGSLGRIEDWHANRETPVSLTGRLNESDLAISGTAGPILPEPVARLDVSLTAGSVATFSPFAGVGLPDLQNGAVSARFVSGNGRLTGENISVALDDRRLSLEVSGEVADLADLDGIDLTVSALTDSGAELLAGLGPDLSFSLPPNLRLNGTVQGGLRELAVDDFELIVQDQGLDARLTGSLADLTTRPAGAAELQIELDSTELIGRYLGLALPRFGPFTGTARLSSTDTAMRLDELLVELTDSAASVRLSGGAERIGKDGEGRFELAGLALRATAESDRLQDIVDRLGVAVPGTLPASFALSATASGSLDKLGIDDLQVSLADDGLDVRLTGTMADLMDVAGVTADLSAAVDDTAAIGKYAGIELPALGSVKLDGRVVASGDTYRLEKLDARLDGDQVTAQVTAMIEDLLALTAVATDPGGYGAAGIDASVAASAPSVAGLARAAAGVELPEVGALELEGHLRSSAQSLALDDFNAALTGELVEAELAAAVEDLLALTAVATDPGSYSAAGIDASLAARTASVAGLARIAGAEIPEVGALRLDGHVESAAQSLALDDFQAVLTGDGYTVDVTGQIIDLLGLTGVQATVDGDLRSLAALSGVIETELPETGPWTISVSAHSERPVSGPVTASAQVSGEGITAVAEAVLPDVKTPQRFAAELDIEAESIARVGALLGREFVEDMPLEITGEASGEAGAYRVESFNVRSGESEIVADLAYRYPPAAEVERKTLTGTLTMREIDLTPWLVSEQEAEPPVKEAVPPAPADTEPLVKETAPPESVQTEPAQNGEEPKQTGKRIFSSEPFALGLLSEYDIDLRFEAQDLAAPSDIIIDGEVGISLKQGLLEVKPIIIAESSGGSGYGHITLDARSRDARLDAEIDFDNFASPRFGGMFDVNIDLEGNGESPAALMGSLNGYATASIEGMELKKTFMTGFGAGLFSQLNPVGDDTTALECAVARFDITDGVADFNRKIAAQTEQVTWIGGGEVDLKTEEIDIGFSSKARQALSALTTVNLAGLVQIRGTLAEPSFGVNAVDVAKKYAEYTAFFMTGGLSWLAEKAVETAQANVNQCERILADLEDL